ncbi:MAG: hypothetical protein HYX92_02260 [Chloroflexi bacterium]|nr:hypothetical protein [Chloroflexota bacterium]
MNTSLEARSVKHEAGSGRDEAGGARRATKTRATGSNSRSALLASPFALLASLSVGVLAVTVMSLALFSTPAATESAPQAVQQDVNAISQPPARDSSLIASVAKATRPADMTPLDRDILALAKAAAVESVQALERAIDQGTKSEVEIFSTLYFPISPPTSPRTFSTFYDDYIDAVVRPIQEGYLGKNNSIVFAILVDRNGYVPSHNLKFSQPRTGNLEADLKANRSKRIFNDVTGFRAAKNREEYLLQVYRRDTGERMKDLSVPVLVKGKHWGAFRIGYADE